MCVVLPRTRGDIEAFLTADKNGLSHIVDGLCQTSVRFAANGNKTFPTVIIAIDQGEELFGEDQKEGRQFIQLFANALKSHDNFFAIFTIRSDALQRFQDDRSLTEIPREAITLDPMLEGSYQAS
jgi:conflict system STAND superfamily ATPase